MTEQSSLTIQCEDHFDPWSATANLVLTSLILMILALNYLKKNQYCTYHSSSARIPPLLHIFYFLQLSVLCLDELRF